METWPEAVTDKQAGWPTTPAASLRCEHDKNNQKSTSKNPTDESNTVESVIGVLQILEDLTHEKLNVL